MSVKIFCLETLLLSTALIGLASAQGANRQSEGPSKEQTLEYINERVGFNQGEFPDAWRTFSLEGKDRFTRQDNNHLFEVVFGLRAIANRIERKYEV